MRDKQQFLPVNWVDGMKINKAHFIEQDNAWADQNHRTSSLLLTPLRYGILPPSLGTEDSFNVKISYDNQNSIKATVFTMQGITCGGISVNLPVQNTSLQAHGSELVSRTFTFTTGSNDNIWWIFLVVHPFDKQATGSPDANENPPRFPNVLPTYSLELVSNTNYANYALHPYAMSVGKILANGNDVKPDEEYIPPCFSVNAHPDLLALYGELDKYLAAVEVNCSEIVQKIYRKNQQNDISELVLFLCDRVILFLGDAITKMRWQIMYDAPAAMFEIIAAMSRVMKNSIDMRIGSGKDELMNYLSEWCELKQGELETMLGNQANAPFVQNDMNQNIKSVILFVKVTSRLFNSLSKLEFIGKKKESGIFVKEEAIVQETTAAKPRRRFLG